MCSVFGARRPALWACRFLALWVCPVSSLSEPQCLTCKMGITVMPHACRRPSEKAFSNQELQYYLCLMCEHRI